MTETEWLSSTNLDQLYSDRLRAASGLTRKLQLFACGSCRQIWAHLDDPRSRKAVEVAEEFADGLATVHLLDTAFDAAEAVCDELFPLREPRTVSENAAFAACNAIRAPSDIWASVAYVLAATRPHTDLTDSFWQNVRFLTALFRDVFGNPFRRPRLEPQWLSPTILSQASRIYEHRDFGQMDELAERVEQVGCNDDDILEHCRSGAVHIRGCWVLDELLGKHDRLLYS